MAGVYEADEEWPETEGPTAGAGTREADGAAVPDAGADTETAELVAQIRELAAHDPAGVQQVVSEVLAALDRATRGAFRDQLSDGTSFGGGLDEPPVRVTDLEAAAIDRRSTDTG